MHMAKCNLQDKCIKYSICNHGQSQAPQIVYDFTKVCFNQEFAMYSEFYPNGHRDTPKVEDSVVVGEIEGEKRDSDGTIN